MKNIMQRIRNRKGFTLVELMIVVAIIGILAAIAIPAFLRAVKKSKTSEADGNVKKMVDGAKAYFTSEQKYSPAVAAGGAEPWHAPGAGNSAVGFPVTWSGYVFPGGAANSLNTSTNTSTSQLTVTSSGTVGGSETSCGANAPTGGAKVLPFAGVQPPANSMQAVVLNKLNVTFTDPAYFQYHYAASGTGGDAAAVAGARADFKEGANCHTLYQAVVVDAVSQEVQIIPSVTTFEFE